MKTKWIILAVCVVVLVTAAIGIRLTVLAEASPAADQAGPYTVGFVVNTYYDSTRSDFAGGPWPIQTFIWYPAEADNNGTPMLPAVYPIINLVGPAALPDASSTYFEAYGIDLAYQAVVASDNTPFPLVVLSPGQAASSTLYVQIGARLASHGFVVAIPTHLADRKTATGEPEFYPTYELYSVASYTERIRDIQYLMTRLVADSSQSGNLLTGTIRPEEIAVAGHSWGGAAALALAGGDDSACDMQGLDPSQFPSEICIPILPDPRVKAIITIDGANQVFMYEDMARIKIPTMGIGEEWNTLLEMGQSYSESWQARQHAAIQSHPNYRVDVASAKHMSFANVCAVNQVLNDLGIIDDATLDAILQAVCPSEPVSEEEIGTLTSQYMIAFLKTELVRERDYKGMLTPEYALENEPFIEFFETEQGSPDETVEDGYFSYFKHQGSTERAKALKDPFMKAP